MIWVYMGLCVLIPYNIVLAVRHYRRLRGVTRKDILDALGFVGIMALILACWAVVALVKGGW